MENFIPAIPELAKAVGNTEADGHRAAVAITTTGVYVLALCVCMCACLPVCVRMWESVYLHAIVGVRGGNAPTKEANIKLMREGLCYHAFIGRPWDRNPLSVYATRMACIKYVH